jgi:hypothetical protein
MPHFLEYHLFLAFNQKFILPQYIIFLVSKMHKRRPEADLGMRDMVAELSHVYNEISFSLHDV